MIDHSQSPAVFQIGDRVQAKGAPSNLGWVGTVILLEYDPASLCSPPPGNLSVEVEWDNGDITTWMNTALEQSPEQVILVDSDFPPEQIPDSAVLQINLRQGEGWELQFTIRGDNDKQDACNRVARYPKYRIRYQQGAEVTLFLHKS